MQINNFPDVSDDFKASNALVWLEQLPKYIYINVSCRLENDDNHIVVGEDDVDLINGDNQRYAAQWNVNLLWINDDKYDTSHYIAIDPIGYSVSLTITPTSLQMEGDQSIGAVQINGYGDTIVEAVWDAKCSYDLLMTRKITNTHMGD
jgi:hypothetical protein